MKLRYEKEDLATMIKTAKLLYKKAQTAESEKAKQLLSSYHFLKSEIKQNLGGKYRTFYPLDYTLTLRVNNEVKFEEFDQEVVIMRPIEIVLFNEKGEILFEVNNLNYNVDNHTSRTLLEEWYYDWFLDIENDKDIEKAKPHFKKIFEEGF